VPGPTGPQGATGPQGPAGPAGTATVVCSDTPPAGAADNSLWWESDSGLLYTRYNDGTSTQWVLVTPQPDLSAFVLEAPKDVNTYGRKNAGWNAVVSKAGDTMSGPLVISDLTTPTLKLNKTSTGNATINGTMSDVLRWALVLGNQGVEAGSSAGSDFAINSYTDAGALIGAAMTITRSNLKVTFGGGLVNGGNIESPGVVYGNGFALQSPAGVVLNGNAAASNIYFDNPSGSYLQYSRGNGNYYFAVNGTIGCWLLWSGVIGIQVSGAAAKPGGGPWVDSSDIRIKTVIADYTTGLDAVANLHPVTFIYKGNDTREPPEDVKAPAPYPNSHHHQAALDQKQFHGLVAQEVETIFPEMVTKRDGYIDGKPVTDLRDLDTGPLIFALINAVKELKARIETLEGA
jgi:hypothetical protein